MTLEKRIQIEKDIATKIIDDALALGYLISVFDDEEWTVKKSCDRKVIIDALMTTDNNVLEFYRNDKSHLGWVDLVYGNDGYDVICDHSVNDDTEKLLSGAKALAEKFYQEHGNV